MRSQQLSMTTAPCEHIPFLFSWVRRRKVDSASISAAQTSGVVNLVLSRQTGYFESEHPSIDKPMIIAEPAVPGARLLGLGSKLYPSNM